MKQRRFRAMLPFTIAAMLCLGGAVAAYYLLPSAKAPVPSTAKTPDAPAPATLPSTAAQDPSALAARAQLEAEQATLKDKEAQVNSLLTELTVGQSKTDAARKVAKVYAAMPPYKAAPSLESLDNATVLEILRLLDEDQAAAIVTYMNPQRGGQLMKALMVPPPAPATNKP